LGCWRFFEADWRCNSCLLLFSPHFFIISVCLVTFVVDEAA
jgi:hypothetical protein